MQIKAWIAYFLKWTVISCLVGVLGGTASAIFLISLEMATRLRDQHTWLIWFLPVGGLLMGLIYHRWGRSVESGNNLIVDEIHNPRAVIPLRMAPMILLGTILTHVFGGSAGREGTAVQMGGSLADQLAEPLGLKKEERRTLLMAGMSAGFGSVFGVPLAGMVFGLEVLTIGRLKLGAAFECLLASVVGHFTCLAWGVKHTAYFPPTVTQVSIQSVLWVALAGIAFGFCAQVFSLTIHATSRGFKKMITYAPLRPFVGGIFVLLGFWILGTFRYAGLGVPVMEQALREPVSAFDFIWKMLFTIITLGAGFKGGEVTPLLFIGSTLGNSLSALIPLPFSMLAAVGFVAVFAGAANTPWACTIMAIEIFGSPIAIYALIGCLMSYFTSGHMGIYHAQELAKHKLHFFGSLGRHIKSMRKKSKPALLFFLLMFSIHAFATTIESETSLGREITSEDLSGNGKFPTSYKKGMGNSYSWNLGYTNTRSTSTDSTTGEKITDRTGDLNLGLGLETPSKWTADLGFDYSTTPDENLAQFGPNGSIGYTYEFSENDGFHRDITAKLLLASSEYAQTFTKTRARRKGVTRPTTGSNTIRQNSVGVSLSSNVFEWLTVKIQSVKYSYNKDVVQFLAFLDSSRSVVAGRSGLSSTVTGLPDTENRFKVTFYMGEDWALALSETAAKSIVDGSIAWTTKGLLSRDFGDSWNVGLGYQNESSDQVHDNLAIIDVKYFF